MQIYDGSTIIIACPSCGKLLRRKTYSFVDEIGSNIWSDGKDEDSPYQGAMDVTRCGHCHSIFWISDAATLGEVNRQEAVDKMPTDLENKEWVEAPEVMSLGTAGLAETISLTKNSKREKVIRIDLWRIQNDLFRKLGLDKNEIKRAGSFLQNLEALISLSDEAIPYEFVLKAEVLRELGHFEASLTLLAKSGEVVK
jgi:hypothetical protein